MKHQKSSYQAFQEEFRLNFDWAARFDATITRILKEHLDLMISVKASVPIKDRRRACDFEIKVSGTDVSFRARRNIGYRDLTIRAMSGGERTELEKIKGGFVDWFFYLWAGEGDKRMADWMLVDVGQLRRSGLLLKDRRLIPNKDGRTGFVAIPRGELCENDCVATEKFQEDRKARLAKQCKWGEHVWEDRPKAGRVGVWCSVCDKFYGNKR